MASENATVRAHTRRERGPTCVASLPAPSARSPPPPIGQAGKRARRMDTSRERVASASARKGCAPTDFRKSRAMASGAACGSARGEKKGRGCGWRRNGLEPTRTVEERMDITGYSDKSPPLLRGLLWTALPLNSGHTGSLRSPRKSHLVRPTITKVSPWQVSEVAGAAIVFIPFLGRLQRLDA